MKDIAGRCSVAAYRFLLRAYPGWFRERFGAGMAEDFAELLVGSGYARAWRVVLRDLFTSIPREWWRAFAVARGSSSRFSLLKDLAQDLRYALRTLRTSPLFVTTSVLMLGIGIGLTTAMFSVLRGVLIEPLPINDEAKLVRVEKRTPEDGTLAPFAAVDAAVFGERSRAFEQVAGVQYDGAWPIPVVVGDRETETMVLGTAVSADFFTVLGLTAALGRVFDVSDDTRDESVVVISHAFWQNRFGGDPSVLEQTIRGSGRSLRIIGVAPAGFEYPKGVEVWTPWRFTPEQIENRVATYSLIGRLRPGVAIRDARLEVTSFLREREREVYLPHEPVGHLPSVVPLREAIVGDTRMALVILFAAAALVLLTACVNVAGLLFVRAAARQRELSVRVALGASQLRIVRQLLTEGCVLALAGGGVGILLAFSAMRGLLHIAPPDLPRLDRVGLDVTVLGFAVFVSAASIIAAALAPALWAARSDLQRVLRSGIRVDPDSRRLRFSKQGLVAGQITMAFIVLAAATLLAESLIRLERVDMGFDTDRLAIGRVQLAGAEYRDRGRYLRFSEALIAGLEASSAIDAATMVTGAPFTGERGWTTVYALEGQSADDAALNPVLNYEASLPNYFNALGVRVLYGRPFSDADREESLPVAIVSERLARRAWPDRDPIGMRIKRGGPASDEAWMTVVGVVADTRYRDLTVPMPSIYVPVFQNGVLPRTLVVRASTADADIAPLIRATVRELDADERVYEIASLEKLLDAPLARPRFTTFVLTGFAAVALLLAAIGLYGLMASIVLQRTREFGVRRALGAQQRDIMCHVLGRAVLLVGIGSAFGIAGALSAGRALSAMLFDVRSADPLALGLTVVLLAITGILACWLPSRRAARVDPVEAIRTD